MSKRIWTPEQQDAIEARGGTVLVSAAAGSGKTAVLVQRVIERLTDPVNPTDADRLLVVTFTRAAAAEMKERIALRLSELIAADPANLRLQRQQLLLQRASISTVHSFCGEIVRDNFFKLDIPPDFRISDDSEMALLRTDAVTRVLEDYYAQDDPVFSELVESFSSDRDDSRIIRTINTLYDFIRSHPFPQRWLEEKAAMYREGLPAGQTAWGACVLSYARSAVDYCITIVKNGIAAMQEDEKLAAAYSGAYEEDLAALLALRDAACSGDWDTIARRIALHTLARLKPLRGYGDDPLKLRLAAARKEYKDTIDRLKALFSMTEEECGDDIRRIAPLLAKLFEVTGKFSDTLDALKAERRAADFGDLEHWALRLLVKTTPDGWERTPEAVEIGARFDEVMVDEYQDTNEAQDMLFRAVSRDESNLFMVGDVKQSIYGFRQAMPGIFLARRESFPPYGRAHPAYPARIVLDRNFRSRREVTDAVNYVFGQLMSPEAGDVEYTGTERLAAGAQYPDQPGCAARLDIIDLSQGPDTPSEIAESRHIAQMISQMIADGVQVTDGGEQRACTWGDFCILLRSANKYAPVYARELQSLGVPAWADTAGGFFESSEIAVMLSLLRVIDNPVQDIPLLASLLSPIYGFTPDDAARIRRLNRKDPFYFALLAAAPDDPRVQAFLRDMEEYRTVAATMPADDFIRLLYERTGYPDLVQAMPGGELRLANLRLLLSHAARYEKSGYNGLTGFVRFLDRLQAQENDLAGASTLTEASNVVRVMSIHRSKGLEFPICIVAGCARRFNKEHGDSLLHPVLGMGVKLRDAETLCRYTTLPREAIAVEQDRESMSEELRILYVAMTRAREKLILVASPKHLDKTLGALAAQLTDAPRISPYVVRSASSISDWLLLCALRRPEGEALRDRAFAPSDIVAADPGAQPWEIGVFLPPEEPEKADRQLLEHTAQPDPAFSQTLRKNLNYIYPWDSLSGVPAKVAASELASGEYEEQYIAFSRPAFLGSKGMTPAERGTALHAYMQFADYGAAAADPDAERARLVEGGWLTPEQGGAVDMRRVRAFFAGGLAQRILSARRCWREYRFTVEIPASRVRPELSGDPADQKIVLQGAVDCIFEEENGLVIVDYKTDRAASPAELWERYRAQLSLYREAVQQCFSQPVTQCLLYSFSLNQTIGGELS